MHKDLIELVGFAICAEKVGRVMLKDGGVKNVSMMFAFPVFLQNNLQWKKNKKVMVVRDPKLKIKLLCVLSWSEYIGLT